MSEFRFSAERVLDAPAHVVYHCIADYRHHHRVGGILPTAYTDLQVLRGGIGAGTVIRFTTKVGGRTATRTQEVSEPEPGRVLIERGNGEGSTFTVEPRGEQAVVRIETVLQARGLEGLLLSLVGSRLLRPLYADELDRLEQHARAHRPDVTHGEDDAEAAQPRSIGAA